jgi:serine/threonine protein kinase
LDELQPGDPARVGQYVLLGRLGAGGMGRVFLGRSPGGRHVAVKLIRAEVAADPEFRARFSREVAAARMVNGLFTAAVVDADPSAPLPWLVTNFVNGPSLAAAVAERGPLPVPSVLALAVGLAEGLDAVHATGVVHRDLKPSNVLLAQDGPRLIDFGISQSTDVTALTAVGMVVGSPGFMSPEQAEGATVGPASDVFSLGAVLAFAATGDGPFGTGTPGARLYRIVNSEPQLERVPDEVRPFLERCLAKDPARRPTAAQLLAELVAAHPSAADLSDWLPPSIWSAAPPPAVPPGRLAGKVSTGTTSPPGPAADQASEADQAPAADQEGAAEQAPRSGEEPVTVTAAVAERPGEGESESGPAAPPEPSRTGTVSWIRRRRVVLGAAAAVVLGAGIAGVVIAVSPGDPPVLAPAGLTADLVSSSSVTFTWAGPATGPAPDKYEVFRDGRHAGDVPGNTTVYRDTRLTPASSYKFEVVASRNGKLSPHSVTLSLKTALPPVSDAVLTGKWSAHYKVTGTSHFTYSSAKTWAETWEITPDCSSGPCSVKVSSNGADQEQDAFKLSLDRAGAVYAGSTTVGGFAYCEASKTNLNAIMKVKIAVQGAEFKGKVWTASSWKGTVNWNVAATPKCNASAVSAALGSP